MPTIKQKTAFKKVMENMEKGNPKTAGELLVESGYSSKASRIPSRVFKSDGFKELLDQIDDNAILSRIYQILRDDDKRSSLSAADMLLKLKDKYPAGKIKMGALDERDSVFEIEEYEK
jgi:hypothetical protein